MEIVMHPNEVLAATASPISKTDKKTISTLQEMAKYITGNEKAAGLALPQVGISKRGFVIKEYGDDDQFKVLVVINPVIVKRSDEMATEEEGCLSLPGFSVPVERPKWVEVMYFTPNFKVKKEKLKGFTARVFQHEFDHLNGIMITDKGEAITK